MEQRMQSERREEITSSLCDRLEPVGRILEDPDYNVWGCSPIYGPDGEVHVFYSKWPNEAAHKGWLTVSEVGHAVAPRPEGPYEVLESALKGRGGNAWDSMTIHNPTIHRVGDLYYLFYMGNCDGTVTSKRVGVAVSDSLAGPWERKPSPIIPAGTEVSDWDTAVTTNPAFLVHPDGTFRLYYKGWNLEDWIYDTEVMGTRPGTSDTGHRTNRRYGMAIADVPDGPYRKYHENPIVDMRRFIPGAQCEDAYVWHQDGVFRMLMRDMGYWNHEYGLLFESEDGIHWGEPAIGFRNSHAYFPEAPSNLDREGRFERPQFLMRNGRPEYLFVAMVGGAYGTSSGAVLKVG
jgi:hypothetical protein